MNNDIDSFISNIINDNSYQDIGNGIMLTNREIEVLKRYDIDYKSSNNLKELIFTIEDILNDTDIVFEDLEEVQMSISERDYYENTNK